MNALSAIAIDDHAHVQDQFELYADAEAAGENAPELFPDLWLHLQACAECRQAYVEFNADAERSE